MNIKLKRVLSRIALVLLLVIVVILGIRAVLNYTTGRKLQAYLEDAKAKGIPLSLKEIAPHCDDPDNAARFWKAAEALFIVPETENKELISRTIEDFFYARTLKEESRKKLTALAEKNRRALELVLEASGKPCFRYGDWTKRSPAIEPDNLVRMIQAIRLLGIDAELRAEAGQISAGLDECLQGMHFIRKTLDEPFLINNLIALANMKSVLNCFNRIVRDRDIDSETLAAWIKEMDPGAWRARFSRCIQTERVFLLESGLRAIKGDREALKETESEGNMFFYWLTRPIQKPQIIWVQNQFRDLDKKVDLPYFEMKEWAKEKARESVPWYFKMSGLQRVDFQSGFLKEATLEAMMLTTKAGLACKIYKNKTGHYPEKLETLVPELLGKVPVDPFTGKPLIYRLQDGGVLIYSVGSNEKDDGGRGTYQITQLIMDKDDDWAWSEK